jgi:Carboxypeptidase regulatory-like domain/TonB dependent receptor
MHRIPGSLTPRTALVVFLLCFSCAQGWSQQATAQITGLVTDASNAGVPGATITITNVDTGVSSTTTSNESGNYVFPVLNPGKYNIVVSKTGFDEVTRSGIELSVSQVARFDFALQVGSSKVSIQVNAAAPPLETSTASLGQVIASKSIVDLPLNGRNFLQLAKLTTGVSNPKPGDRTAAGGGFVANGVRSQLNNFMLDGIDNNEKIVDQQNSSPVVIQPSVDALQEFKVETNNYSAEYGYSAGAVVNAVIKSGTNQFHGTAFEFLRNDVFDARDFFLAPSAKKPPLQQNQFGGTFGGPILRNKLFFFGSWEQTRLNVGKTQVLTVPTAAMKTGNFAGQALIYDPNTTTANPSGTGFVRTAFANNVIPASRIDPVAANLLALEPLPNAPGTINNYIASPINTNRVNRMDLRGDDHISDTDQLFARYSYTPADSVTPGPFPAPLIGSTNFQTANKHDVANGAALGETHTFSPTVVNEFRLGYNRVQDDLTPYVNDYINSQFGILGIPQLPGVTGLPQFTISGFAGLGEATFLPNNKISETATVEDHVSWVKGKHSLSAGGTYRWVRSWFNISAAARGSFTFNGTFTQNPQRPTGTGSGLADLLVGIPSNAELSNEIAGDIRYRYIGSYIQDSWKLTDKLTLNLGARYELWTQPFERQDLQGNFLRNVQKFIYPLGLVPPGMPAALTTSIPSGLGRRSLLKQDSNNIAPRVGLAYQLTGKTVVRAGFGQFFADDPAIGASARPPANPPFFQDVTFPTNQITPVLFLSTGFPANTIGRSINPGNATLAAWDPNFKQAYVYHWSVGFQRQLGQFVLDANYVGTSGFELPLTYDVNSPYPGGGSVASRRPFQGFGTINFTIPMGNSNYNALEMRLERRYANGFAVLASYTYSKSIDNGDSSLVGDLMLRDARNVKLERGLASNDIRHNFVLSSSYDLPFGKGRRFSISNPIANAVAGNWQINGIGTIRTGTPFTPQLGFSSANTGDNRPSRIASGNLPSDQRSINNWFDKTAFVAAPFYQFGNAGRDILTGPGAVNFDLSAFKNVPVPKFGETGDIQFRAEMFNAFNHPQFANPNNRVDLPQGGTITSLSNSMRIVQFGLKLLF